jgi:hypothetical protein
VLGDADGVGAATASGDGTSAGELAASELAAAAGGSERGPALTAAALTAAALTAAALMGVDPLAAVPGAAAALAPAEVRWLLVHAARVATQRAAATQLTPLEGDRSCRAGVRLVFRARLAMDPG